MSDEQRDELAWFKSSYSGTSGGDCVEAAVTPDVVYIRDSKSQAETLSFPREQWAAFTGYARETTA